MKHTNINTIEPDYSSSSEEETEVSLTSSLLPSPEKPRTSRFNTDRLPSPTRQLFSSSFSSSSSSSSSTSPIITATIPPPGSLSPTITGNGNGNGNGEWKSKTSLQGSKMCSFYYHNGYCQKGGNCNFSHEFKEGMEVPPLPMEINYRNPRERHQHHPYGSHNVQCKFILRGRCLLGSKCKFSHAAPPAMYPISLDFRPFFPQDTKDAGGETREREIEDERFLKKEKAVAVEVEKEKEMEMEGKGERFEEKKASDVSTEAVRKLNIVRRKDYPKKC